MPRRALIALATLFFTAGCFLDGRLNEKGAGTLKLNYRMAPGAKLASLRKMMESSFVTVKNAEVDKDNWVTFDLDIKDATKLSSAAFFKNVQVKIVDGAEKGTKTLQVKHSNDKPITMPDKMREYYGNEFRLTLTLPGEVAKSNATETKGATATWKMTLDDFLKAKSFDFEATYKVK